MPPASQVHAIQVLAPHVLDIVALHDEVNGRIVSRRREFVALDSHQRKVRTSAERRAHVATGMRALLDGADGWSLRRDYLDSGRYEWDVEDDLAVRLAKRLPVDEQPPALTTASMKLFEEDAGPRLERDRLLIRLLGDPLYGSASIDVACFVGRDQEWRMTLASIARADVVALRPATPVVPGQSPRVVPAKPKTTVRLLRGAGSEQADGQSSR